ncbi:C1 family peptidase [Chryseobacterium sp. CT-SW4]|uniref:C1 family peptidase n=1 Tax=Chryseobacterium sp. SW-1 TaxID=3157343 RepID=UPI003B02ADE3
MKKIDLFMMLSVVCFMQISCNDNLSKNENPLLENNSIEYATGYIPSTKEQLAQMKTLSNDGSMRKTTIPKSYILPELPIPLDQGSKGACVPYAIAHARTILNPEPKKMGDQTNFAAYASPEYLYEKYKWKSGCSIGALFVDILDALKADGTSRQDLTGTLPCGAQPTAAQEATISKFRVNDYFILNVTKNDVSSLDIIKEQIAQGSPVIIGIAIDYDFFSVGKGKIWNINTSSPYGNHAVVITGYDDDKHAFQILNSWGASWGDNGYGWVDYNKLAKEISPDTYVLQVDNPLKYYSANSPFVYLNKDVANISDNIYLNNDYSSYMQNSAFNWNNNYVNSFYNEYINPSLVLSYPTISYIHPNEGLNTDDLRFEIRIKMKPSKTTTYPSNMKKGIEFSMYDYAMRKSISCNVPLDGNENSIFRNSLGELGEARIYPIINFNTENRFVTLKFNIKKGKFFYGDNYTYRYPSGINKMTEFTIKFIGTMGVVDDIRIYSDQKQIGIDHMDGNSSTKSAPWLKWFL